MEDNLHQGWATCPLTENGCVRILSQPNYPGSLPVAEIARRLKAATADAAHSFWADAISLCDDSRFCHEHISKPKLLTDVYLLALAVEKGGRLVTFDQDIPLVAVKGAMPHHLLLL